MAKIPTLSDIVNVLTSALTFNSNNDAIQAAFENTLSRDGSSPNQMEADLDLNSNDLLNVKSIDTGQLKIGGVTTTPANYLPSWKGDWVTETEYSLFDFIKNNGSAYVAVQAHTSNSFAQDLVDEKWELVVESGSVGPGSGDMLGANNLSDVDSAMTSLSNIGGQPIDATLTTLSGQTVTAAGLALLDDADVATQRATLGLSLSADADFTQDPDDVSVRSVLATKIDGGTAGPTAATGLSTVSFNALPADITEIEFNLGKLSLTGTDNVLIQLSTSSTYATTGYLSTQSDFGATSSATSSSTAGFFLVIGTAPAQTIGRLILTKTPGEDTWTATGVCRRDGARTNITSGDVTLAGAVDGIRITVSGGNTFDAGAPWISYKTRAS